MKAHEKERNSSSLSNFNAKLALCITNIVDFFYPPFKKIIPLQIFRYGATGGANVCLDWLLYFVCYNFIYDKSLFHLGNLITFTPHIASLFTVFPITFLTGFWLARYVSFSDSNLKGRTQIFRYYLVVMFNLVFNYAGLKLLVEICGWYPTPSKMFITICATIISFLAQKYFTFKVDKTKPSRH